MKFLNAKIRSRLILYPIIFILIWFLYYIGIITNKWILIHGASMEPTIQTPALLFMNNSVPSDNDIIVFKRKNEIYVKRVIHTAKDQIKFFKSEGIYIESTPIDNSLNVQKYKYNIKSFYLTPDEYWVLGDNNAVAIDSRMIGPVHQREILGVVRWGFSLWHGVINLHTGAK